MSEKYAGGVPFQGVILIDPATGVAYAADSGKFAEDSPHTSGAIGSLMLAIRHDSDVSTADNGDYTVLKLDEAGRLKVSTQPVSITSSSQNITEVGESLFVNVTRASNVMFHVKNTGSVALAAGTFVFEASLDSTNGTDGTWFGVQAVRSNSNTIDTSIALTGIAAGAGYANAWEASVNACSWFRIRCTVATTASSIATWIVQPGSYATEPIPAAQASATQAVSGSVTAVVTGQGVESAAAAGNAARVGSRVRTSADTSLAANDAVDHTATSAGQLLVKNGGLTETAWSANVALTTTTATALVAALASQKRHLTGLQAINTGAATVDLILLDGLTERWRMPLPPNVPVNFTFESTHLPVTVNTAFNANLSAASTVRVCAQGYTSL